MDGQADVGDQEWMICSREELLTPRGVAINGPLSRMGQYALVISSINSTLSRPGLMPSAIEPCSIALMEKTIARYGGDPASFSRSVAPLVIARFLGRATRVSVPVPIDSQRDHHSCGRHGGREQRAQPDLSHRRGPQP